MTNSDLILHFVNKYISEKEKNTILEQQLKLLKQQKQMSDEKTVKTKSSNT